MAASTYVYRALISPLVARGCKAVGLGVLPEAAARRLDRIKLNNWMARISSETNIHYYSVAPAMNLLIKEVFNGGYGLKNDHIYSVMSSRAIHIGFLRDYSAEVVTAMDNFREEGRIFAVSRLRAPIAGFSYIETGQPYRNNPEPERIAHVALCMVDKQGRYLPAQEREASMHKWLQFLGLDQKESVASFEYRGIKFTGIRKDMFGGRLTAIKFNIVYRDQSYQVEVRVDPIQETLGEAQEALKDEIAHI